MDSSLPFLITGDPLPAVYKARWEDFLVEEVLAGGPDGTGNHLWMLVEKRGLTTARAAADLARLLGVKPSTVGYAGLKDARAIARQWMSVEHVTPERALAISDARITVLRAERHGRKLKRGWHVGNRFFIRLRPPGTRFEEGSPVDPAITALESAEPPDFGSALDPAFIAQRLDRLATSGVPNYYGPQRFGSRGDTWLVGRALARGDLDEAVALIAGRPLLPDDPAVDPASGINPDQDDILRARSLFDAGEFEAAAEAWPRGYGQCARLAAAMARTGGDAGRALPVVGKGMLRLYASAWQARLFNAVLAARMPDIDRLVAGDLAWKHDTEALFLVEDPATEQHRADAFEISATGPLIGQRLRTPSLDAGALEARALEAAGYDARDLESAALRPLTGRRRPLRFQLRQPEVQPGTDDGGAYVELRFALPPGCYATAVLRELGAGGIVEGGPSTSTSTSTSTSD